MFSEKTKCAGRSIYSHRRSQVDDAPQSLPDCSWWRLAVTDNGWQRLGSGKGRGSGMRATGPFTRLQYW